MGVREFVLNMDYLQLMHWDNDTIFVHLQILSSSGRSHLENGASQCFKVIGNFQITPGNGYES